MSNQHSFNNRSTADEVIAAHDLTGKTAIVTGSNAGIGFETARALASKGARVIFACRNMEKGKAAVDATKAAHPGCLVELKQLDLASFASVRSFCEGIDAKKIDILVCNAGLFSLGYSATEEGFETTVGVCHFGHFLLVNLLMDKIKAASGRVVVVSSESHRWPRKLDFDRFPLAQTQYNPLTAYGQAKLANVFFANEIQRRFSADGVTACSLHPGTFVTTQIFSGNIFTKIVGQLASVFTKNPNQGAATSVLCAVWPDTDYIAGEYFVDCTPGRATKESQDPAPAAKLWELSERLCQLEKVTN